MSDLSSVRAWSHEKRIAKLKEVQVWLEAEVRDPENRRVQETLDLGVLILLETFSAAGLPPFETYESLLDCRQGTAWEMLGMRMLDTRCLVARFKAEDKDGKQRLRSKISARGMI